MEQNTSLYPHFKNYQHSCPFPKFQRPHPVGCYSLDSDRNYIDSRINIQYLHLPKSTFKFDLNEGYSNYEEAERRDEKLDTILQFIERNWKNVTHSEEKRLIADFVCFRGLLTQILISPYFTRDSWSILATRYKDTVYLIDHCSQEKLEAKKSTTEYQKRCCYYGHKFEQFVLTPDPAQEPKPTEALNEKKEFAVVFKGGLGKFRLLYGAEIDGVDESQDLGDDIVPLERLRLTEVKTKMWDATERQYNNFLKYKLPKWWCQSFLVAIERIHYGLRTDDGFVEKMDSLDVSRIPKMCQSEWSASVMMTFLQDFLQLIENVMTNVDDPHTVYKFNYNNPVKRSITYEIYRDKNEYSFLPESYINKFNSDIL